MSFTRESAVIEEADVDAVVEVLRSGQLALGPAATTFERELAAYVGVRHGIAVSSGTAGLHVAVVAVGIGAGDEVITSPLSFVPSANCFVYEGARPIFVDIEERTLGPDPSAIEAKISARTRAIVTVDLFHQPVDHAPIRDLAERHGLVIIEDACEVLGAECRGERAGALGDIGVFGFYPNKQITTGEGGMIVTDRQDWAQRCRSLRNQGRDPGDTWLRHSRIGYNYRLDEMSAALGLSQLRRLDSLLERRDAIARAYRERIATLERVSAAPLAESTSRASYFVFPILLDPASSRLAVLEALVGRGIPARPYFDCIHLQRPYRDRFGYSEGDFPRAEALSARSLALPVHGNMTEADVDFVCEALRDAVR